MKRWLNLLGLCLFSACFEPLDSTTPDEREKVQRPNGPPTGSTEWPEQKPPTKGCEGQNSRGVMRVLPLGDSITLGVDGGYRRKLHDQLGSRRSRIDFVGTQQDANAGIADNQHEGHPGFNIGNISSNLDGWLNQANPDLIILMIGTNDVAWWSARTAAEIGQTHAALVDRILAARPNAWLVVASIPPLTSQTIQTLNMDRAQVAREYNAVVRQTAESRAAAGKRVWFVDVHSALTTDDLYDGVHPDADAHGRIAQLLAPAIESALDGCSN